MKKVLIAILVIIILVGIGVGGYFGYIKVVKPMLDEKNQQDVEQIDELGGLLNVDENETSTSETMQSELDESGSKSDDLLSDTVQASESVSEESLDSFNIPLTQDSSKDEIRAYVESVKDTDEFFNFILSIVALPNNTQEYVNLCQEYKSWRCVAFSDDIINRYKLSDDASLTENLSLVFNGGNAEKKISVVKGVLTRLASSDVKQKFEYNGSQTGEFLVVPLDSVSANLYYAPTDNVENVFCKYGYPGYLVAVIDASGNLTDYTAQLDEIIPRFKSILDIFDSDPKYTLYANISDIVDEMNKEYDEGNKSTDGDVLNEESAGIGETLEESGQL